MSNVERKFVQREGHVEVVTTVEKEKMSSKDILTTVKRFETEIAKKNDQMVQLDQQKKNLQTGIDTDTKLLKDIRRHEAWAKTEQEKLARALIKSKVPEKVAKVNEEYKEDPALTTELNQKQKYQRVQNWLARDDEIIEKVHEDYLKAYIFKDPIFEDPFQ